MCKICDLLIKKNLMEGEVLIFKFVEKERKRKTNFKAKKYFYFLKTHYVN